MAVKKGVTNHAIIRWMERVEEIDLSLLRCNAKSLGYYADDSGLISYIIATGAIDIKAIADKIMSPTVRFGIRAGASYVRLGDNIIVVIADGVVKTVKKKNKPGTWARLKVGRPTGKHRRAALAMNDD